MKAEMRALAHDLAKDSIVTDALAQFIAQVIEELHKTKIAPAEARALAAEAKADALREALSYAHMGLDRIHTALMGNGPKQAAGEMVAHFQDAAAGALTQEQPNVGE